jgi:hypothetical protein
VLLALAVVAVVVVVVVVVMEDAETAPLPGAVDFEWISVHFTRTIDPFFHPLYKTSFRSKNQLDWGVKFRFKMYRNLYNSLTDKGVRIEAPFPCTYVRSKFGIQLNETLLENRTVLLGQVSVVAVLGY